MAYGTLGDVEFVVVRLFHDRLSPTVLEALVRQVESASLRLLDLVLVDRTAHDHYRLIEIDGAELTLAGLALYAPGLVCHDDVRRLVSTVPEGAVAAVLLVEPLWTTRFAHEVEARGDRILTTQRIPARVANAVLTSTLP